MHTIDEAELVAQAVNAAQKPVGLRIGPFKASAGSDRKSTDGTIDIFHGHKRQQYLVVIRSILHNAALPPLAATAHRSGEPLLLIAGRISPGQTRALKSAGIQFMDTAGNCYLDFPGLHILVVGRQPEGGRLRSPPRRDFSAAAVRLIYQYLASAVSSATTETSIINRPYREIAAITGVSLGSIASAHATLESLEFLVPATDGVRLVRRKALLERWVGAYADRLRPKLVVARFRATVPNWWTGVTLDPAIALWGGEPAAARFTSHLKPGVITLYRFGSVNPLILAHDLRKDDAGDVEILDAFWTSPSLRDGDCVHPLLAYADLIASGVDRNIETAGILYEQRLRRFVETD